MKWRSLQLGDLGDEQGLCETTFSKGKLKNRYSLAISEDMITDRLSLFALVITEILAGSIIAQVFSVPGIGRLLISSVSNGLSVSAGHCVIHNGRCHIINFIVDVLYSSWTPCEDVVRRRKSTMKKRNYNLIIRT